MIGDPFIRAWEPWGSLPLGLGGIGEPSPMGLGGKKKCVEL